MNYQRNPVVYDNQSFKNCLNCSSVMILWPNNVGVNQNFGNRSDCNKNCSIHCFKVFVGPIQASTTQKAVCTCEEGFGF